LFSDKDADNDGGPPDFEEEEFVDMEGEDNPEDWEGVGDEGGGSV